MSILSYYLACFTILMLSCEKDNQLMLSEITDKTSQKEDSTFLDSLYKDVSALGLHAACIEASEWGFIAIGAKACGGPAGYIAYHKIINTAKFNEKVSFYTAQQDIYNKKWNIISDCALAIRPKGIVCENGLPKFLY